MNIFVYLNVFFEFVRTTERNPDVVIVEPIELFCVARMNGTVSQDTDSLASYLSFILFYVMCLFLFKFLIRRLIVSNINDNG